MAIADTSHPVKTLTVRIKMTLTPQNAPAPPVTPYTPSWMLYVYDEIAYLTFNGRLAATAAYHTPTEQARINGVYARLTGAHSTDAMQQ
jgi:hypothetical protein